MKLCPFRFDDPYNSYCIGNRCEFFVGGKCAVVVMAENSNKAEAVKDFSALLVNKAKSTKERFLLESLVESVMKEMGCNDESKT